MCSCVSSVYTSVSVKEMFYYVSRFLKESIGCFGTAAPARMYLFSLVNCKKADISSKMSEMITFDKKSQPASHIMKKAKALTEILVSVKI